MSVEYIEFPDWAVTGVEVMESGEVILYLAPIEDD